MKLLKAICIILCTIFCFCLISVPFMYESGRIKDFRTGMVLLAVFFLLAVASRLGYWIIRDHERNTSTDWLDYCNKIAPRAATRGRRYKKSI